MVRKSHAIPKQDRKKQVYDMMGNIRLQSQRDHKCQCPFCHAKVLFFCWSNMGSILAWSPDWLNACFYDLDSTFHSSNHIKSPSLLSDFLFISDISTAKPPDHSTFRRPSATTPWYETVPSPPVFAARPNASWPPAPGRPTGSPTTGCHGMLGWTNDGTSTKTWG